MSRGSQPPGNAYDTDFMDEIPTERVPPLQPEHPVLLAPEHQQAEVNQPDHKSRRATPFPHIEPKAVPVVTVRQQERAALGLTVEEMFILSRIDGEMSLEELQWVMVGVTIDTFHRLLRRLWEDGVLVFIERKSTAELGPD